MSENTTKQNLGNISSNLKHIVGFLTNRNWLILVPRIKKFIENTKQIYDQTNVDKNQIIFKKFEELLAKNIDQKLAEDYLYFQTRFFNFSTSSLFP